MGVESFPPPTHLPSAQPPSLRESTFPREPYRNARARLWSLRGLLAATSLAVGAFEALGVRALLIEDWSTGEGLRAAEAAVAVGSVATWCWLASCVALAVWTGRVYRNLFALGVDGLRFTPGWGVGAWFVPFLNLVRPKQIIDDAWRATSPDALPWRWRASPVPATLHVWWGLLILSWLSSPYTDGEPADRTRLVGTLVGAVPVIVCGALTWVVTSELTARQEAVAHERALQDSETTEGGGWLRTRSAAVVVVAGLFVVGLGLGTVIGFAQPAESSTSVTTTNPAQPADPEPRATHVIDLEVGDCFGPPASLPTTIEEGEEIDTVDVLPCDVPHVYEVIDVVVHDAESGAAYPGEDTLFEYGAERCGVRFEGIVGIPFLQSELDVQVVAPTGMGWRLGDREIQCMALRRDGRPLDHTVVGTRR